MKTPSNSFDAADLSLCRAHGNADSGSATNGGALIGYLAAKPAAEKPQAQTAQPTHYVCIREHASAHCKIGDVIPAHRTDGTSSLFLPCDSQGWITHIPADDSVCPVPADVLCAIKQEDDEPRGVTKINPPRLGNGWFGWDSIIVAWRPTGAAA